MKITNLFLTILITSLFWACENSDVPNPEPNLPDQQPIENKAVLELKWTTRMDFEKEIVNLAQGIVYEDWFIRSGDLGFPAKLMAFNKNTGEKDWEYTYDGFDNNEIVLTFLFKNILICRTGKRIFGFDLNHNALLWEVNLRELNIRPSTGAIGDNNLFYLCADLDFKGKNHTQYLMEFNIFTGDYRIVYSAKANEYMIGISPPVYYNNGKQELLIFNEYPKFSEPPERTSQNMVAIDLHTTEVVWRTENFTEAFQTNTLYPPVIYNNKVITGGDWSIYGFNADNGEKLWRYAFDYPWGIWATTNHLIHNDRLYVNNTIEDVTCLNPNTGALIWNNPQGGANCTDNMLYYEKEDLLVFTSWGYGSVMVLDALNGKTLHRERAYEYSQFNNDVVYDAESDMFFTSTYKHAIGFKVIRP